MKIVRRAGAPCRAWSGPGTRMLAAMLALGLLAACGRVGPPRPPGPADQVTYPRPYPAR